MSSSANPPRNEFSRGQPTRHAFRMAKSKPKKFDVTYIRDWRKHRNLTLERLASRVGMTTSNLSKIERGAQAYTQPALEALAKALSCGPGDLITRPPGARSDLGALIESLDPELKKQAITVIEALKKAKAA